MRDLWRQPNFVVGVVLLMLVAVAVAFGPWLAPYDPQAFHPQARLQPPSVHFLLGTDQFGRDLLSRLLAGARPTVLFGVGATTLGVVAGALIGLVAGVSAGTVDAVIMRVLDGLIAVPDLLFALLIVTVLGNGMGNALLAVAIAFTPGLARITRSTVLSLRSRDYVLAATARGEGRPWIILCEILPNAVGPVIIEATIRVAFAVMIGATLGFLGLGAQPPSTEWGLMIASTRQFMARNIWTVLVPSVAIAMVALGFNLLGDALRDRLDVRGRR
jgi:peptide/nickel transport system permease protein